MEGTMSKLEIVFLAVAIGACLIFIVIVAFIDWRGWDRSRLRRDQALLDSEEEVDAAKHWLA
jgi:hypothetical protein